MVYWACFKRKLIAYSSIGFADSKRFGGAFFIMNKRKYIRLISFFAALSVFLGAVAIAGAVKATRLSRAAAVSNEQAIGQLCENLDSIAVALQKGVYCSDGQMLADVSKKLSAGASCAKISLGQLTSKDMITDDVYKFLSQVGDFTASLVKNAQSGQTPDESQRKQLKALSDYSKKLSDGVSALQGDYYDGTVAFEKDYSNIDSAQSKSISLFSDSMQDVSQSLEAYPTLTYDGPFSDSRLEKEAKGLNGKREITADEAKRIAANLLETEQTALHRDEDESSKTALYCFSKGNKSVGITKKGGLLCYMTNPDLSGEAAISEKEAVKRAKNYLDSIGYKNMKESYYSDYDGVCTINFAFEKSGVTYYADLIKVSVALDSGKVCALDARSFLTNHEKRTLPEKLISKSEAQKKLISSLKVISSKKTLIPTDYGNERLCYEFHCKDNDKQEVLIYINAQNANQEDVLLLVYADGGTLTK